MRNREVGQHHWTKPFGRHVAVDRMVRNSLLYCHRVSDESGLLRRLDCLQRKAWKRQWLRQCR